MRAELATEINTRRIVVMDGDLSTTIEPGCVTVEKLTLDGSRVAMRAASDGGEVVVAGHVAPDEDPRVCARLYAGDEGCDDGLTAFVSLESHRIETRRRTFGGPQRGGVDVMSTIVDPAIAEDDWDERYQRLRARLARLAEF